jgi:hypothetical protein
VSRVTSSAFLLCCAVTALATHPVVAQDPSRGTPAVKTDVRGPCRTYDTSGTVVSLTGTLKGTTNFSGVYDPWAKRTTQQVTYNDGRGLQLAFTQVTTYASPDDLVAEVVRLQQPAQLSTTPPARQTLVVPPLTRFVRIAASGAIGFTLTNTFDGNGRLTGSTHVQPAGRTLTSYTAWDSSGRPTAGTVRSTTQSSTLSIVYDDNARSSTTTTTSGNMVVTGTQTYDVNGNPRVYTQSSNLSATVSTTTTTAGSSATVCLGDLRTPVVPPLVSLDTNANGTLTATVDGRSWTPALGVKGQYTKAAENGSPIVSVGGRDSRYLISVGFAAQSGPGEYIAGLMDADTLAQMTREQFSEITRRNSVVASVFDSATQSAWQADPSHGRGTVSVASLSATGASGTFSLTLEPTPGTPASATITVAGSFTVKF